MTKKYLLTKLVLQKSDFTLYSDDPKEAFLNRVLEPADKPLDYLKRKGIVSVSDGVVWLTNGVDYYPAWPDELWEYEGDEPVGSRLEEFTKETA